MQNWPLARLVERDCALASFCTSNVDSDRQNVSHSIYAWLAGVDPARNDPTNRGAIAAWAWGFHRCVDYLATDADFGSHHIAVVSHSRNGKALLLATAFDERIALAIPHQAGCGWSAPSRTTIKGVETVERINAVFPHWFNGEFNRFNSVPAAAFRSTLPGCALRAAPRALFKCTGRWVGQSSPPIRGAPGGGHSVSVSRRGRPRGQGDAAAAPTRGQPAWLLHPRRQTLNDRRRLGGLHEICRPSLRLESLTPCTCSRCRHSDQNHQSWRSERAGHDLEHPR